MPLYHSSLPKGCPPKDATPMHGTIYRSLEQDPATEKDFRSHREVPRRCTGDECKCWATSIWVDIEHVRHALKQYAPLRGRPIAKLEINEKCGVVKHTGSGPQPEHRSFWRDMNTKFAPMCQIVDPYAEGS